MIAVNLGSKHWVYIDLKIFARFTEYVE